MLNRTQRGIVLLELLLASAIGLALLLHLALFALLARIARLSASEAGDEIVRRLRWLRLRLS